MKRCKECSKLFEPTRSWMIFCTEVCREAWYRAVHLKFKAFRQKQHAKR